jgi:hypothetical protein
MPRQGIMHFAIAFEGFDASIAVRLDDTAEGPAAVLSGGQAQYTSLTADDLLIRVVLPEDRGIRALDLCALDASGGMSGHYVRCTLDGCFQGEATGRVLARLPEADSSGLTLGGEYGGADLWPLGISVNVRVHGGLAYLARYQDGLRILDVSDVNSIQEIGHLPPEFPAEGEIYNDVKLVEVGGSTYAILASDLVGAVVVEVTDPAAPTVVAHFGSPPVDGAAIGVHTLAVDAGRAYLGNPEVGLEIWDLADPRAPGYLGRWFHPGGQGYLHDLFVRGDRAYLNYWSDGMAIVDVADPAAVQLIGNFAGYGQNTSHSSWVMDIAGKPYALHGDEQYGAHLNLVEVDEASAGFATAVGTWETRAEVSIHNVMAAGELALLAYYQDGVRVLDVSTPSSPRLAAWFNTWPGYDVAHGLSFYEGAVGVDFDPVTRKVYVADSHRGLLVLDLALLP